MEGSVGPAPERWEVEEWFEGEEGMACKVAQPGGEMQ